MAPIEAREQTPAVAALSGRNQLFAYSFSNCSMIAALFPFDCDAMSIL